MTKQLKEIEIPFGAKDSELKGWEYTIPEGMEAEIKNGKIIVREKESEDKRMKNFIYNELACLRAVDEKGSARYNELTEAIDWLKKQGEQKSEEEVDNLHNYLYGEQKPVKEYNITGIGSKNAQGKLGEMIKNLKLVNEVFEQKPTWSEEDCLQLDAAINIVANSGHMCTSDWLKSLKDRVGCEVNCTTTNEWSEEDYNEIETIACHLDNTSNEGMAEVLRNIRDKYYHIIPQNTWKPSDEQMYNLSEAAHYNCAFFDMEILKGLYDDLKKLREE